MTPIAGTEGYPPWLQLVAAVAFMVTLGVTAALSKRQGERAAAKKEAEEKKTAANTAGHMMVMQPSAERLTQDALVQTMAGLKHAIDQLNARMDRDDMEDKLRQEIGLEALLKSVQEKKRE